MQTIRDEIGFDWPHLATTFILCFFGLTMLYSASSVIAFDQFGDSFFYLKKQALIFFASVAFLFVFSKIDYEIWIKFSGVLFILSLGMMITPLIPGIGHEAGGGVRWVGWGVLKFQPSEWAKIFCVIYLSSYAVKHEDKIHQFKKGFLPPVLICLIFSALCLLQPDLGNACLIMVVALISLFIMGAKVRHILFTISLSIVPLTILLIKSPYRMRRLMSFWHPWDDPKDTSYQIIQSFMSFAKGGLIGEGVGNGQSKLYYLPEAQTDFIASVVGEELGLIGLIFLTLVFLFFILRTFKIATQSKRKSGYYLAIFAGVLLGLEIFGNLFVVSGLVPTKGLPLPFLSQGGSSLLCSLIACGLIQSVAHYGNKETRLRNE